MSNCVSMMNLLSKRRRYDSGVLFAHAQGALAGTSCCSRRSLTDLFTKRQRHYESHPQIRMRQPVVPVPLSRRKEAYDLAGEPMLCTVLGRGDYPFGSRTISTCLHTPVPLSDWSHCLRLRRQSLSSPLTVVHARSTLAF